ncbi:2-oxoglutarate dehydrogenase complex dihydrolipoyllysine-residue succinyltransferase [Acidihalobacter ferrooxydans]|uniref:Dihydrolipoyllysine-residue succinyltransferase component of 2-oxoglutarate dehydrogenase complex n=1 Tax=Acidihalobacter ferrooxydans TaxID=1765967 RepID=A0A1P8UKH6_9GAMM|nr:2-oxoglutarate dehydrogenase complex dihydrolipoyllysine-residue succinyltransferase [Acidihalobacter ferrooxydans]APZ44341.1 dihydrolipoamide succinyltransferase [Acidihalobacter ferrooxydans]
MNTEVKVPQLPESVADATIAAWHKKPGDRVAADENLVDLETDKVVLEVPSPGSGILSEVLVPEGEVVTAGQALARLVDKQEEDDAAPAPEKPPANGTAATAPVGPAVRRLLDEHGLSANDIEGSGKNGRILKEDVLARAAAAPAAEPVPAPPTPTPAATPAAAPASARSEAPTPDVTGERSEKRVPMTRLRARIAERLVQAQHNAAMLTTFNEVDMQPSMELRKRYRDRFEKTHEVRLGFMSFFVMAAVAALKRFPAVNASIDGTDIVYHGFYDIGVAVSSPRGLVVPILRDADLLSPADIERRICDFATRARDSSLGIDDITGGTFTISNGGVFGSMLSTPILNPPQSAILGMHKIQERPVVVEGEITIRPMMYLALSYDHRIIDGREAVQFLAAIKDAIEDPARLLLEL